jgi:hypothetical protein
MSSVSYLPHVSPPNNNTRQIRRRVDDIVSQVSQQVGSIADGTGDIGTLHSGLQTKAPADSPVFTGTVTQPTLPALTNAQLSTYATAGGASSLPTAPAGYTTISINGQQFKIALFAV